MWIFAQDVLDPTAVAQDLGKAQNVQEVLAIVVSVLLIFLLAVVVFHVREARRWEAKYEKRLTKNEKTWRKVERSIAALAGFADSLDGEENDDDE